ncbi:MAG: EAL domain-containing protein [Okeania sp. SIO3B5]|uniref:bifunctional diguanylate cyclase/phosphodiesterase n=1 Tax=Okeania sp. SIO3B5 TaxID=2607811 RepID=UPI001400B684|nr:EAL domain-containing protein [Okeania sp. SIO3B5]NEO57617.1 EAL domain-containing protein [Okeania sp. SIO3B5]
MSKLGKNISLSQRLHHKVLVLSFLALAGMAGTFVSSILGRLHVVRSDFEKTSILAVETFERFFIELESSLKSSQYVIQGKSDPRLFLLSFLSQHEYVTQIFITDLQGEIIAQESYFADKQENNSLTVKSYIDNMQGQDFYLSQVIYQQGESFIYAGVLIANQIGSLDRALLVKINLTELWSKALDINVGNNGYIYLVDETNNIIIYPNRKYIGTEIVDGKTGNKSALNKANYHLVLSKSLTGSFVLSCTNLLRTVPWYVVVEQPVNESLKPILWITEILMLIVLVLLLLLLDIIRFTKNRLILPLTAIKEMLQETTQGKIIDLKTMKSLLDIFSVKSDDELTNFANFHLQLQKTKQEIEQLNQELEQRVSERTAQLEAEIRRRKKAQKQIIHIALHDSLTGLPNRTWLIEKISEELVRTRENTGYQFALLFLDGDRFKLVNDSLGHSIGDRLLVAVAQRLNKELPSECDVARLGGDEFTVLIEDVKNLQHAKAIAQKLLTIFNQPFKLEQQRIIFGFSIGVLLSDLTYDDPNQMLRDADLAMYAAKAQGSGIYHVFDELMRQQSIERMCLETDLQQAVSLNQLYVNYQPIINFATGKLAGFEALVRWQHPELGFVSPGIFIPIAEEIGLVAKIDRWVLKQACQQMVFWQKELNIPVSFVMGVNLSRRQFADPNMIPHIDAILSDTGLSPQYLKLEITETAIIDNPQSAKIVLEELKSRSISLAIDDFGVGYSSLSYLHQFPVHTLKIDRSFVCKLQTDKSIEPILMAIVTMAHNLNMTIIAEGIEENIERCKLQSLGCEMGQGYLFSKPLGVKEATQFIIKNRR